MKIALAREEANKSSLETVLAEKGEELDTVYTEVDRLRASVEEIVLQRAVQTGQAHLSVIGEGCVHTCELLLDCCVVCGFDCFCAVSCVKCCCSAISC